MGACASKQEQQQAQPEDPPIAPAIGSCKDESVVSMSFLKKYSFATVNPAFSDFENMSRNNPEEEEAICKLRILAQESFGGALVAAAAAAASVSPGRSSDHRRVSFCDREDGGGRDGANLASRLEIEELGELPPIQMKRKINRGRERRVSEEKLVMSSSCMPNYSLGVVVNPEVRKSSRRG